MGHSLVIVNPNASRMRDAQARDLLVDQLRATLAHRDGADPTIVVTTRQEDTRPAVEAGLADGASAIVGVGGDGTLRDVAAVLRGTDVPLGVVPAGTGNQLAAVMGIPLSLTAAVEALGSCEPKSIDLGEVALQLADGSERRDIFTIGCGVGFDARIMASTPPGWKKRVGRAAYFLQALKLAMAVEAVPYVLDIDGRTVETEASIALVGNMGQLIPGMLDLRLPIVPDDGLLDLIVVGARGPIHGIKGLADQLLRTNLGGDSGAESLRIRGREISVASDRPEPLEVDGDYVGEGSLAAKVMPAAIQVLVPRRAS